MGVVPARDPGPGKAKPKSGDSITEAKMPTKGKKTSKESKKVSLAQLGSKIRERCHKSVLGNVKRTKAAPTRSPCVTGHAHSRKTCKRESTRLLMSD